MAAALSLGPAGIGHGATVDATTVTFGYTGSEQTFTVPAGVTSLHVVAVGAKGGKGSDYGPNYFGGTGGFGARLESDLAVTPGDVLFIEVGGTGVDSGGSGGGAGGFNGGGNSYVGSSFTGGGGGGATDIRSCSALAASCTGAADTLSSRLLVAAGGGGGGSLGQGTSHNGGGAGGAAGSNGLDGSASGCNGGTTPGNGGGPGTQTAGGAGGAAGNNNSSAGNPGSLGKGGAAGVSGAEVGGGGGGGYYGGGAGGNGNGCTGGGGGGGSNLAPSTASLSTDSSGTPSVTLTYTPPSTTTTPTTTNTPPVGAAIVSDATQTHKRWRESNNPKLARISRKLAPVGTTFRFTLDKAAAIRLVFAQVVPGRRVNGRCVATTKRNRHNPKCSRNVTRGRLTRAGHAGLNTVKFYGWLSRSKNLKPGKYGLVIVALTPGVGSTSQKLTFTIVR